MAKILFKIEDFVNSEKSENYKSTSSFLIDKDLPSLKFEFFSEGKPLYFHVTDPDGVVRVQLLSKYEPKFVLLHEEELKSGIGTCPGKIKKGTWGITVFTFGARVNSSAGKVTYNVKVYEGSADDIAESEYVSWIDQDEFKAGKIILKNFENKNNVNELKWLRGDFHSHTILSDGSASPVELLSEGLSKKLDFFFITEHGILSTSFPVEKKITVYPSYEVTTASGHFNIIGLRYLIETYQDKGPSPEWSDIKRIMTDVRESGALVSINHPLHFPWLWIYNDLPLSLIDSVEIISDPYAEGALEFNNRTVELLDLIWNEGYRITALGGSDTHTFYSESQLGQPVTEVFAKPGSLNSLLAGVRNHNVSIFTDLECLFEYRLKGETVLPGINIENTDDVDLEIIFDPLESAEVFFLNIVEDGMKVVETKIDAGLKTSVHRKFHGKSKWIRCEIRDSMNMIRGYLNPLHRGGKESSVKTWGDALNLLE